jgi:hypothetical protein
MDLTKKLEEEAINKGGLEREGVESKDSPIG